MRNLLLCLAAACTLAAQPGRQFTDGEDHGDAPYLIEDGWTALLGPGGKPLAGWQSYGKLGNEWLSCKGIVWDGLAAPSRLACTGGAGDRILNGPKNKTNNVYTERKFGDAELYLEFMLAKGSNSGVYLQGLYEVQVFDSFGKSAPLEYSDGGGIYHRWINNKGVGGSAPRVNASRAPGQWQSYHVWFRAPRFDAAGRKVENAKFLRVLYNGVPVQENVEVEGQTRSGMDLPEAPQNPLMLQGDHGPVAYRNVYIRPAAAAQ
jgi:hypothetical protein